MKGHPMGDLKGVDEAYPETLWDSAQGGGRKGFGSFKGGGGIRGEQQATNLPNNGNTRKGGSTSEEREVGWPVCSWGKEGADEE